MVVESSPSRLKYAPAVVVAEAHFVIVHGSVFGEWAATANDPLPWTHARRSSSS
jgi:hypothetical protein